MIGARGEGGAGRAGLQKAAGTAGGGREGGEGGRRQASRLCAVPHRAERLDESAHLHPALPGVK